MKKLILSLSFVVMTFMLGYSQMHLTLADSLGSLPNDTTRVISGSDTLLDIESYLFVTNTSANTIWVKVRKVDVSLMDSSENYFCWGLCYQIGTNLSFDSIEIRAGATNKTDFAGHYNPHHGVGFSVIRYVFFDQNNRNDSVGVNIKYDTRPLGVDNKIIRNSNLTAFPNPADNSANFVYRFAQGSDAIILVRNILGSVVKETSLNTEVGKISVNTSDLSNGIYFCSLVENGVSVSTKKLIVKH